jgi:hypothetical protein
VQKYDAFQRQALELIVTQRGKSNPFDLTQESDQMRDQYGREEWGQAFLVARRLVEAGVRMVQVNLRGWDTHQNAFRDLKGKLLPSLDRSLSGFLDDLTGRGLLDETLVVWGGEFGRTPAAEDSTDRPEVQVAEPPEMSILGVATQFYAMPRIAFTVSPTVFIPPPKPAIHAHYSNMIQPAPISPLPGREKRPGGE